MSKRQQLREKHRRQERLQRVGLVLVMVLVGAAVVGWVIQAQRPAEGIVQVTSMPRPQANFNATGDPNAPVKIIEYSDFQCPYCKNFWQDTEGQLLDQYVKTGKVYFEYRSVGLFIGPESARAAEAAYCAGDQEKFWEMHDSIFANQGAENAGALDDAHLNAFARTIGLDMAQFSGCFEGKYDSRVAQDKVDAAAAGINSTPSFLINGKLVEGALPFAEFQKEIEDALAAASAE
jgi:protein-disulfide isomerase